MNIIADHILDSSMADFAVYFLQTVVHYSAIQYEIFYTSILEIHIGAVVFLDSRYRSACQRRYDRYHSKTFTLKVRPQGFTVKLSYYTLSGLAPIDRAKKTVTSGCFSLLS